MKPFIVISPSINSSEEEITLSRAYCKAINMAGGTPIIADYSNAENLVELADGLLLSGGGDIEPSLTGDRADIKNQGQISKLRDEFEYKLLQNALSKDIPVLGICRGMQVIGGFNGAHIIQHMEGHRQSLDRNETFHDVLVKRGTLLYDIVKTEKLSVNSFHHQAVGKGFQGIISADADGSIEAVELQGKKFVLGVQWHPEYLCDRYEHFNIFKTFINAATKGEEYK